MELVTARAPQHYGAYLPFRRLSDEDDAHAAFHPVDELISDTHFARRLGLYDQPTPALPQRSRLRGNSIDAQSISPIWTEGDQGFPSTNATDDSPPTQSAFGTAAEILPSYTHFAGEVQTQTDRDTVSESHQPQEEEDEYCDCVGHGPTEQMLSFATHENIHPESPVSVISSAFIPSRLHARGSVSSLEYGNNYHSSTSGSAVSSWVQNISSRTSYDDVAVDSLTSPSDSARESDEMSYASPLEPYIHVGPDVEGLDCIPTASRDEIAQILREKAEQARTISGAEEKHRSKLSNNLKKVAAKLRLQSAPAEPINPMVLSRMYPSMSLKELEFLSLTPGALSQLQSSKTNVKPVTKIDEDSTKAALKSEKSNTDQSRPTRTLEDVLPSLTSGEKDFLLAHPDAAKILPTVASLSDPSMRPKKQAPSLRSSGHKRTVSAATNYTEPSGDATKADSIGDFASRATVPQPPREPSGRLFSLKTPNWNRTPKSTSPQLSEPQPVPQSQFTGMIWMAEPNPEDQRTSAKEGGLKRLRRISSKLSLLALHNSNTPEDDSECPPIPQSPNVRPPLTSRSLPSFPQPEPTHPTPSTTTTVSNNSSSRPNPARKPSLAHRLATTLSSLPLQARPRIIQRHHPSFAFASQEYSYKPEGDPHVTRSIPVRYFADHDERSDNASGIEYETVEGCQLGGQGLRRGLLSA